MNNIDYEDEALKLFNLDEPILKSIKESAQQCKVYVRDFLFILISTNIRQGNELYATPTEEDIKKVEEEINYLKRISTRFDDYDIKHERIR
jgi:hypothetical protein